MIDVQTKLLANLDKIAERNGCQMVQRAEWGNTGFLYFQRGWENVLIAWYNVQSDRATFNWTLGDNTPVKGMSSIAEGREGHHGRSVSFTNERRGTVDWCRTVPELLSEVGDLLRPVP